MIRILRHIHSRTLLVPLDRWLITLAVVFFFAALYVDGILAWATKAAGLS